MRGVTDVRPQSTGRNPRSTIITPTIDNPSGLAAAHDLRAVMQGQVVLAGEDSYADVRRTWNGAVNHRPALFALCENVKDVQNAVRLLTRTTSHCRYAALDTIGWAVRCGMAAW